METNQAPRSSLSVSEESNKEKVDLKDTKNVKEDSSAERSNENGVRVSENGEKGGKFGDEVGEKKGLQISGDEKVVSFDDDEEMNGVSSLLQIQQSGNLKGLEPVIDAISEREERADEGREKTSEGKIGEVSEVNKKGDGEGHEFKVGDFVWGKIKSHPWWPGRIYDSKDASDYAMKIKAKDRLLVAYFGDGTFAWCSPSQLKPFADNFVEMSGSSGTKNFLNAVEDAVDEVGKLVELEMTCSCVPEENLIGLGRSLVNNAGIKEGVIFPGGGIEKFSTIYFEPVDFVDAMKCIASVASISDVLELSVFKSRLSALYRAKGGYQLPSYYDPQPVPGLEEDSDQIGEFNGGNKEMEVRIWGPVEEDWHSPQEGSRNDQQGESSLRKCQGGPDDNPHQKVKRKSIAEIMEKNHNAEANMDSKSGMPASSTKSKKRKGGDGSCGQGMAAKDKNEVGDADKEKATESDSTRKMKREFIEANVDAEEKLIDVVKAGVDSSKSAVKKKKLKGTNEPAGSNDSTSKPRTRKASKLGESVAAEKPVSNNDVDQNVVSKKTSKRGRKKKESSAVIEFDADEGKKYTGNSLDSVEKQMDVMGGAQSDNGDKQSEKGFSPRERKKSKYLTFPYTNINRGQRKSDVKAESPKPSGDASVEKPRTEATSPSVSGPSSMLKSGDEKNQEKASEDPGTENGKSCKPRPPPLKIDLNNVDPIKVQTPSSEILRGIRSAAISPLRLDNNQSLDVVENFCSAFRSSIYSDGSNQKSKRGRKLKAEESEQSPMVKEQRQTDHKQGRKQKTEEPKVAPLGKEQKQRDHKRGRKEKTEEREVTPLAKDLKMTDHKRRRKQKIEELEVMQLAKEQKQTGHKRGRKQKTEEPEVTPLAKEQKQTDHKRGRKQKTEESEPILLAKERKKTDLKQGIKRKAEESESKLFVKEKKQTDRSSAEHKSRKTKLVKREASERGMPKSKEAATAADTNDNSKESAKENSQRVSGVEGKEQNEPADKTRRAKKTREIEELSGSKSASRSKGVAKTPNKQPAAGGMSQLGYIKQKIEKMSAMLEKSDGKFSPTMKSKLEGEMKGLLEEMNRMTNTSP